MTIQHLHLVIRAETYKDINLEKSLLSEIFLNKTLDQLIEDIDMQVVLPARATYVGTEGNEGYTGNAGLETSHVAYHIWDKQKLIQFDLYTCGCLGEPEILKILQWIQEVVGSMKVINVLYMDRAKGFDILYEGSFLDNTIDIVAEIVGLS